MGGSGEGGDLCFSRFVLKSDGKVASATSDAPEEESEEEEVFFVVEGCPSASADLLVQPDAYEGGFAVWECTWDCLRFLRGFEAERGATSTFSFPQKRKTLFQNLPSVQKATILDLGCGHGLLGIWALRHGARASVFQDLNAEVSNGSNASPTQARGSPHPRSGWVACWKREEKGQVWKTSTAQVLDRATRLNILKNLNLNEAAAAPTVRWDLRRPLESAGVSSAVSFAKELFGGRVLCLATSWRDFPSIRLCSEDSPPPEERKEAEDEAVFDWVLSSESLYRVEAFEDLAALLSRVLKPRGAAFFAAKRYYFGVGGGTLPFLQFLREKHEGAFSAAVVASFGGSSSANVRDVLCVRRII